MGELHIAGGVGGNGKKGAGGQALRPLPKTVNGPTRRGPAALDSKGKGKASDDEYAGEVVSSFPRRGREGGREVEGRSRPPFLTSFSSLRSISSSGAFSLNLLTLALLYFG